MALTRLIYVSKLNFAPKDPEYSRIAVEILMRSRNYNKFKNITSALFLSNNNCMQVIEGDSIELARLMFNISRDDRHTNVKILDKKPVSQRLYGEWSMKLLNAGTSSYKFALEKLELHDEKAYLIVAKYTKGVFEGIKKIDDSNTTEIQTVSYTTKTYKSSILSIKVWPKASQIKLKNRGTLLCSMLLNKKLSFNEILKRLAPVSDEQLIRDLQELDTLGILQVEHNHESDIVSEEVLMFPEKQKKSRFSQLFKNFISAKRQK